MTIKDKLVLAGATALPLSALAVYFSEIQTSVLADGCVYAGQQYSTGACITSPCSSMKQVCQTAGTWACGCS